MHSVEWLARIVYGAIVFVMAVTLAECPTVVKLPGGFTLPECQYYRVYRRRQALYLRICVCA
jgi:hypothetical protein